MRIGILASHPIQYQAPLFRALSRKCDLSVYFAHRQTAQQQGAAGYGTSFEWDIDLLEGYGSRFLTNRAPRPGVDRFLGTDSPEILGEIASGDFDAFVVMGWNLRAYWQAVVACRRVGIPIFARGDSQLATPRSLVRRVAKSIFYPRMLRRFDGFFALGGRARDYLRHFDIPDERIAMSPHIVDNVRFRNAVAGASPTALRELKASLDLPSGRRLLAYVGRLVSIKRPIDAVMGLAASGLRDCTLLIVGDGPERAAMLRAASDSSVDVRFCGFRNQSELPAFYALCDSLVLPGDETWGLVANEAMAVGKPVVASDAAGCVPDLVDPGVTGETFAHGKTDAMGHAIRAVFEGIERCRYSSAIGARMEHFSADRAADSMISFMADRKGRSRAARVSN